MEIYTLSYASFYGDELYNETKVYTDKEKLKEGYREYVLDIAENICDDEEKEQFLAKYGNDDALYRVVEWENFSGEQIYRLVFDKVVID